jgi:hypothetical protein
MAEDSALVLVVLAILKVAALLIGPIVATDLLWSGLGRLAPAGFFAVPLAHALSKWVGLGLGMVLIYVHQDARYHDLHLIFLADSPWNVSFFEFLSERVNPVNYGPVEVVRQLGDQNAGALRWISTALAVLFTASVAASYKFRPWTKALTGAVCSTVIVLWIAYLTIYAISLLFWLLFLLNSWTFLLLAGVVHYYRRREH